MSSFNNNGVTLKGAVIIASLVAGDTLTFTRISVGDGVLPSGQTVLTTEKLVNPLFDVPILSVESDSVAHATVKGAFNNADLNTGFYYREIGLFAINPITKAEELFCYGNAGDEAEWINAVGESSLIEKEIHLVTLIGNATTVTANFDPKALVLKSEFDALMRRKADLDDDDQVVKSQMTVPDTLILYVDAAVADGGDGTENKPFKTIQTAVDAVKYTVGQAVIYIKPGTYAEDVTVYTKPAKVIYLQAYDATNKPNIKSIELQNTGIAVLENLKIYGLGRHYNAIEAGFTNVNFKGLEVTGDNTEGSKGIVIHAGHGIMYDCSINGFIHGIYALYGSGIEAVSPVFSGNTIDMVAEAATIHYYGTSAATKEGWVGGAVLDATVGGALTKDAYSLLIGENTFRNRALASAMTNNISTLLIDVYEDTTGIDGSLGNAAAIIANYYRPLRHMFEKADAGTVTMYTPTVNVTTGNDKVWVYADYTLNGGTIQFAISRDGGANYTVVAETQLVDISATPAGNSMKMRVSITGAVSLRNVAWGCK